MSVISRWERRPRPKAGNAPVGKGCREFRLGKKSLFVTASVLGLVLALILVVFLPPRRLQVIWEAPASELIAAGHGIYALSDKSGLSVWDGSGRVASIPNLASDVALGIGCLATLGQGVLQFAEIAGPNAVVPRWTASCSEDETLLRCEGDGLVLTTRPADGLKFGETWILRAVGPGGSTLWEAPLPGIPQALKCSPTTILLGLVDLSSGGIPRLEALDRKTGRIAWSRALMPGLWRGIGFASTEVAVAALDTGISAFGPDGSPLWTWTRELPVLSALIEDQAVCVATPSHGGFGQVLTPYVIWGISPAGDTIWSRSIRCKPFSLQLWIVREQTASDRGVAVALSRSCVIAFSLDTGQIALSEHTGGQPIAVSAGQILLGQGPDLRLFVFELPEIGR